MNTRERYERNNNIVADYNQGINVSEIAKKYGVTPATIHTVIRNARHDGTTIITRHPGRPSDAINTDRDRDIIARYQAGATLAAVAEIYGITRERVRQIVQRAGVSTQDRAIIAYRNWVIEHGPTIDTTFTQTRSIQATIAAHPEVPANRVRRYLRPRAHESVQGRHPSPRTWSDADIHAALRAAAVDGTVTSTGYTRWRAEGGTIDGRTPPNTTLITWRFGSWRNAAQAAGLAVGRSGRTGYNRHWTRDEAIDAVSRFVHETHQHGMRPTYGRYETWVTNNPGNPSGPYLRHLTGNTWSEILMEILSKKATH